AVDLELDGAGGRRAAADRRADGGGEREGLTVGRGRARAGCQSDGGGRRVGDGQGAADRGEVVVDSGERADGDGDGVLAIGTTDCGRGGEDGCAADDAGAIAIDKTGEGIGQGRV